MLSARCRCIEALQGIRDLSLISSFPSCTLAITHIFSPWYRQTPLRTLDLSPYAFSRMPAPLPRPAFPTTRAATQSVGPLTHQPRSDYKFCNVNMLAIALNVPSPENYHAKLVGNDKSCTWERNWMRSCASSFPTRHSICPDHRTILKRADVRQEQAQLSDPSAFPGSAWEREDGGPRPSYATIPIG